MPTKQIKIELTYRWMFPLGALYV